MKSVKIYYQDDINKLTRKRSGEKKNWRICKM